MNFQAKIFGSKLPKSALRPKTSTPWIKRRKGSRTQEYYVFLSQSSSTFDFTRGEQKSKEWTFLRHNVSDTHMHRRLYGLSFFLTFCENPTKSTSTETPCVNFVFWFVSHKSILLLRTWIYWLPRQEKTHQVSVIHTHKRRIYTRPNKMPKISITYTRIMWHVYMLTYT